MFLYTGFASAVRGVVARPSVAEMKQLVCKRVACAAISRAMSTSAVALEDTPFSRAGPMPLPPDEQREFERLVRARQGAWAYVLTRQAAICRV